jgi:copper chaperone
MQYTLHVPKMSCGGCVNTISNAVKSIDANAKVDADIASKIVKVESVATEQALIEAITNAGYPALAKS